MRTLEPDKCFQALSAGDDEIAAALTALDEGMRAWFSALRHWESQHSSIGRPADSGAVAELVPVAPSNPAGEGGSEGDAPVDDETLLARLDPEVANAVRVKRRLSARKSDLRELIREVGASLEARRKKPRRSQWWS